MSVRALITWPYKAGGRSRRGLHKAGTTVPVILLLMLWFAGVMARLVRVRFRVIF